MRDVPAVRRIRREAISQLAAPTLGADEALEGASSAEHGREHRAFEEHVVTVAEVGQQPVDRVERPHDRVEGLYVDPEYARRGVGKRLMQHAETLIREAGYKSVHLHASRNGGSSTGRLASDLRVRKTPKLAFR